MKEIINELGRVKWWQFTKQRRLKLALLLQAVLIAETVSQDVEAIKECQKAYNKAYHIK